MVVGVRFGNTHFFYIKDLVKTDVQLVNLIGVCYVGDRLIKNHKRSPEVFY